MIADDRDKGEYVMDATFKAALHRLDPKLGYFFNGYHVVLTYERTVGKPAIVLVIMDEVTKGFRHPDQRDLDLLMASDTQKESLHERLERVSFYMENVRAADKLRTKELIRGLTKDDRIQLAHAFNRISGSGKGNSAFRRIEPKPSRSKGEQPPVPGTQGDKHDNIIQSH